MITGIVVALPEELSTLTSKKIGKGCCVFISDKIVLAYSGAGADNARAASELLIAQGAAQLVSWGCAAALTEFLIPGDLVLADTLIDAEANQIRIHNDWFELAKNLLSTRLKIHTGSLAESLGIVAAAADKKHLHTQTGAIAVDMESIAVAKVARQNNVPFIAIRTIADPAGMDLPKAINHSLNDQGDIVLAKLLLFLALHPAELPGLIKLGLHFNAAKNTLKSVAKQLDRLTALASQDR
ncbi:phosphorylase [Candidatus Methylobacter oryzae]|uniref:Phosphorylase n=1 Tax=Candidatus Methylobacter oryzae TaxID=2497749 RepID=A0ABY3C6H0_9GAMM|nr:phosphorylase [Candidatus Methylobacter oryzae]TRW90871.1 phosphorylase [Candidatus Methylobacter oryzae]